MAAIETKILGKPAMTAPSCGDGGYLERHLCDPFTFASVRTSLRCPVQRQG
jgi:hypothetical protein